MRGNNETRVKKLGRTSDIRRYVKNVQLLCLFFLNRYICLCIGRAWLYQALADHLLESYVRCYIDNTQLVRRYYVQDALVLDEQVYFFLL